MNTCSRGSRRLLGLPKASSYETLLDVEDKFPNRPTIPYELTVYACALNHKDVARRWIHLLSIGDQELKVKSLSFRICKAARVMCLWVMLTHSTIAFPLLLRLA
jgi:hypothetical protein